MNFGQYKFIKKTIKTIVIFCVFSAFIHTLAVFSAFSIKADTSCPTVSISTNSELNSLKKFESLTVTIRPTSSNSTYSSQAYYQSKTGLASAPLSGTVSEIIGTKNISVGFSETGTFLFFVKYAFSGCDQTESNRLEARVISETASNDPSIEMSDSAPVIMGTNNSSFILSRGSGIGGLLEMVTNFFLLIIGAFSVISIMAGGIRYITAGDDAAKVEKAKKSIIYAIVAIILVSFSAIIIQLVGTIL